MAEPENADGIERHGLLSTTALLDLFEIDGDARRTIEREHRPQIVSIDHPTYGTALVRDQKPMSMTGLSQSIDDGTSPQDFLAFLNQRAFFWVKESRLATLTSARAYRSKPRLVYVLDTASVVAAHGDRVLLSPINSGATKPFAAPRRLDMFRSIARFDWEARRKYAEPVVEFTVASGVPDLAAHLVRVETWKAGEKLA